MRIRARWALGAVTAIGLGAVVSGPLPGGTARAQETDAALTYTCRFPSGTSQQVGVRVRGTFPAAGTAGEPVRPGRVTASVTVPKAALPEVTALGGASVVGTVKLGVTVTQNAKPARTSWPGLTTAATPVSEDADLVLDASGDVPPVTPAGTGDLTFTAGDLALEIGPPDAKGHASAKPLAVACAPAGDRAPALATVRVSAGGTRAPEAARAPKTAPGETPPECGTMPAPTDDWLPGCVYLSGFSNVKKLHGAAQLNDPEFAEPALTNVLYMITDTGASVRQRFVTPLRSRSTFLTFDLMPTTATMEMTQRPVGPGKDYGTFEAVSDMQTGIQSVTAHMRMSIRLFDVRVDGTPLDVGPRCRTATDADITLKGTMTSILEGGTLEGTFAIPAFRGCGAGEDLDPLFSGTVAGAGNLLRVSLGSTCIPFAEISCPPVLPKPRHSAAPQA
ncbi:hypothetical protein E1293_44655 [Actinomadura darangshiensis]|uniref:DUF6801 domain-containing protein n=1 Tax=Actinomadura darangshiensis TaxID=705336 RepID=A0A4R4ZRZ8_9ACTN|nr:DUF6801 domain-containing protein [Actinomadura darangshiensis]TDD61818.1 hypothetical protein E1293_44655 [Actinomadura darangshiensis]